MARIGRLWDFVSSFLHRLGSTDCVGGSSDGFQTSWSGGSHGTSWAGGKGGWRSSDVQPVTPLLLSSREAEHVRSLPLAICCHLLLSVHIIVGIPRFGKHTIRIVLQRFGRGHCVHYHAIVARGICTSLWWERQFLALAVLVEVLARCCAPHRRPARAPTLVSTWRRSMTGLPSPHLWSCFLGLQRFLRSVSDSCQCLALFLLVQRLR